MILIMYNNILLLYICKQLDIRKIEKNIVEKSKINYT